MLINKFEWIGLAAIATVVLCFGQISSSPGVDAAPRADGGAAATAPKFNAGDAGQAGCAGAMHASPFARGAANCVAEAAPALAAENGNAKELRAKVNRVPACQGHQQVNNLTAACVKLNAGAASLVRQLEALVELGDAQARLELSELVRLQLAARTASGEYLDELERAEAVLLRIAASGGVDAEKQIARPAGPSAGGPRFAN